MGLEGPFASAFISSSLAFNHYDSDLTTIFYVYVRDCLLRVERITNNLIHQVEHEEVSKKDLMENAEELRDRLRTLSFEVAIKNMNLSHFRRIMKIKSAQKFIRLLMI